MRSGTLIANPTNCRAFVECQQNLRLDRECAANELYESHSGVCLGDFLVDCGERPIIPSNADASVSHVRFYFEDKFSLILQREQT